MKHKNLGSNFDDFLQEQFPGSVMKINVIPYKTKDQAIAYKLQCFLNFLVQDGKPLIDCLPHPASKAGLKLARLMRHMEIREVMG